ncbi:MAG: hypothetical protein ACRDE7_05585 [Sphingobacterium sp.]
MDEQQIKDNYQTLMALEAERYKLQYNRKAYADLMDSDATSHNVRIDATHNLNVTTHSLVVLLDAEMLLIETRITELETQLNTTI